MLELVNFNPEVQSQNQAAIVFVHGFTGDVKKTWRKIPQFLNNIDSLKGWDLLGFGYSSHKIFDLLGLWSADPKLEEIATKLYTSLQTKGKKYDRVAFVAHSMGGLVVQRALVKYDDLRNQRTSHVVLLGTPSAGLDSAEAVSFLKQQIDNMAADGEFIKQLRNDWKRLVLDVKPRFVFRAVAGERDQFVPPDSSLAPFPEALTMVTHGDHLSMLEVESSDDLTVQIIVQTLTTGAAPAGSKNSAKLAIEGGQFAKLIQQLWPSYGQAEATPPATLDDEATVQLALALEQTGDSENAMRLLMAHQAQGTDVVGVLAGRLKRRWWLARKADDLQKARELYQKAYDASGAKGDHDQAYYHGINVAYLTLADGHQVAAARDMAQKVLDHCSKAIDPGSQKWVPATEGDALMILGKTKDGLAKHEQSSKLGLRAREAQSMEEQALRVAELCGLSDADLKQLAGFYEGASG
jgi:pimeloyl-ACP methyl ester carboxylesterase